IRSVRCESREPVPRLAVGGAPPLAARPMAFIRLRTFLRVRTLVAAGPALRLARRDHRAEVPGGRVALGLAACRARRLEVEAEARVLQGLIVAVPRQPGHAVPLRVDLAAAVEAVEEPDAGIRGVRIARRAGVVAVLEHLLDGDARAVTVAVAHDAVERRGGQLSHELQARLSLDCDAQRFFRGVRAVQVGVGDDLATDLDAAARGVDDRLGDVDGPGLFAARTLFPEPRGPADLGYARLVGLHAGPALAARRRAAVVVGVGAGGA